MFSRRIPIALIICVLASHSNLTAQYIGLSSEITGESEFGTTYRVYADFGSPNDYVSAIFATESLYDDPPLVISTTTSFFQSVYATGNYASGINPAFFAVFPELEFDSWLTIGGGPGESSGTQDVGLDVELASFAGGGNINTEGSYAGGSWFSTINPPFYAGSEGNVLLAQLTSTGVITLSLNLQWKNAIGESADAYGQTLVIGAPVLTGCTNEEACNFNSLAEEDDGSCQLPQACDLCSGETDGTGVIVDGDADDDGVCDEDELLGCTDNSACNFNVNATDSDGSCLTPNPEYCEYCITSNLIGIADDDSDGVCDEDETIGCTDSLACNFNSNPTTDSDPSLCIYATGCYSCSGATDGTGALVDNDADGDGVCDSNEIPGCLDNLACNYNESATDSDDCTYALTCCSA